MSIWKGLCSQVFQCIEGGCERLIITTGSSHDTLMTSRVRPSYAAPVIVQLIPGSIRSYVPTPASQTGLLGLLLWCIKVRDWLLWVAGTLPQSTSTLVQVEFSFVLSGGDSIQFISKQCLIIYEALSRFFAYEISIHQHNTWLFPGPALSTEWTPSW